MAEKGLTREFLAERDLRIFKMRQAGVPIAEIARRFGVGTSNVSNSIRRQLGKLNQEALLAYPEVLQMELERLDALQSAIWPLTQHRKQKMDDGTEVSIEPDIKAVSTVLSIIDRRAKLLGMEQTNVNVQMDVRDASPLRAVLAGAPGVVQSEKFDSEAEAKKLLMLMSDAGIMPRETIKELLGDLSALGEGEDDIQDAEIVDAEGDAVSQKEIDTI
jgi:transposase-like protein